MLYIIVLVILLMLLSGVIAYTGDVLGTVVGKRRLSLFGARPKQTGRIIGVLAGILIMIATLGVLAAVNRQATRVILNAQENAEQLAVASEQLATLNRQVGERTRELEAARRELETAQQEVALLERDRDALEHTVTTLNQDVTTLRAAIGEFGEALSQAEMELRQAEQALQTVQAQLILAHRERLEAEAEAEAARAAVTEAQQRVDTLQTELGQLNTQLALATEELAASREELTLAERGLAEAQQALTAANAELAQALAARESAEQQRLLAVTARDEAELQISALKAAQQQLTSQIDEQNAQLALLNDQIAQLTDTAAELRGQNLELQSRNQQLLQMSGELEEVNRNLVSDIAERNAQLQLLEMEVVQLKEDSRLQVQEIEYLQAQAAAINQGLTFQRAEVIASGIITANEPTAIREQLAQLRTLANQRSAERGGGDIILETSQIESLVNEIMQTPGEHVVIFRSQANQFALAEVRVDVEAFENRKLFSGGQLLVSRQIHLGSSLLSTDRDTVRNNVQLLWQSARSKLLQQGLADGATPYIAPTSLEIDGFTNQLLRLTGPVTVGLQASRDIFAAGPADLEFVIIH
jgi:uncharacterized protein (DUF3084 family)